MPPRVGWHCLDCNRYFQTGGTDPDPERCRYCGSHGSLERIDHPQHPSTKGIVPGAVVACRVLGEVETYVVGEVVSVSDDEVLVHASDGTGTYAVSPDEIVGVRTS